MRRRPVLLWSFAGLVGLSGTCGLNDLDSLDPAAIDRACGLPAVQTPQIAGPSSFYRRWSSLYRGVPGEVATPPAQTGVKQAIDPERISVLAGRVRRKGDGPSLVSGGLDGPLLGATRHPPLPCVTVSVLQRGYGQTRTRSDGHFDLAVNGEGLLTLQFSAPGFLPAQRTVRADPLGYAAVPDVILVPMDEPLQRVALGAARRDVAEVHGRVEREGSLQRQATLLVLPGTTAELVLSADGKTRKKLDELRLGIYEHTVGSGGRAAMPASVPPGTDYTYAATFFEEQAAQAGALRLEFDAAHPVYSYTENFLGFPVGSLVPSGYYDERQGRWVPSDNGRVIRIHDIVERGGDKIAEIDALGTDRATSDDTLDRELALSKEERVYLARRYPKGQTLWRVPLRHLTPYDYNWVLAPPRDAIPPPREQLPQRADSDAFLRGQCWDGDQGRKSLLGGDLLIDCKRQALTYRFVIPDSDKALALHLDSRQTPSFLPQAALWVPLTDPKGSAVPDSLEQIDLTVVVERSEPRVFSFPLMPGPRDPYRRWSAVLSDLWDGQALLEAKAKVRIDYRYQGEYASISTATARVFAQGLPLGPFTRVPAAAGRGVYTVSHEWTDPVVLRSTRNPGLSVGGLGLNQEHFYLRERLALRLGTGEERSAEAVLPLRVRAAVGKGSPGYSSGFRDPLAAELRSPGTLLAVGRDLLFADSGNCGLRLLQGSEVRWLAGKEPTGGQPDCARTAWMGGAADNPLLYSAGLAMSTSTIPQQLFFAIPQWGRVHYLLNDDLLGGGAITSSSVVAVAGGAQQERAGLQSPLELVLDQPQALAREVHPDGKRQLLFIAEAGRVRLLTLLQNPVPRDDASKWPRADWSVRTISDNLRRPLALALARRAQKSVLYVADTGADCIREYQDEECKGWERWQTLRVFGQCGSPGFADGALGAAQLRRPTGLYFDEKNDVLYVVDLGNGRVRLIDLANGRMTTVLGPRPGANEGGTTGLCDGTQQWSERVLLGIPGNLDASGLVAAGIAMNSERELFVSDPVNHRICVITPAASYDKDRRGDQVDLVPSGPITQGAPAPQYFYEFYRGPDLGPQGEEPGEHLRTLRGDKPDEVVYQFAHATIGGVRRLQGVSRCLDAACAQRNELTLLWSADGKTLQEMKTPTRRSLYFLAAPGSNFITAVQGPKREAEPLVQLDYQNGQIGLPSTIVRSADENGAPLPPDQVERVAGLEWDRSGRLVKVQGREVRSSATP